MNGMMAAALILAALAQSDTTVSAEGLTRLRLENAGGSVTVSTWDRNEIRIQADHSRRSELELVRRGGDLHVGLGGDMMFTGIADFTLTVPDALGLDIEGMYIDVRIEGAGGEVSVETLQGDVEIVGGRGSIEVEAVNGEVIVDGAQGEIRIEAVSQGVTIRNASGAVAVEAVSGTITLDNVRSSSIEASSVTGRVVFTGPLAADGDYFFGTHTGRIELNLPPSTSALLSVSTLQGSVRMEFPGSTRDETSRGGMRARYQLGAGEARVELETFNGDVLIRPIGSGSELED